MLWDQWKLETLQFEGKGIKLEFYKTEEKLIL